MNGKAGETMKPEETSPAREAHLEFLRQQIAAGKYHPSAGALARAIMDHMQKKPLRRVA